MTKPCVIIRKKFQHTCLKVLRSAGATGGKFLSKCAKPLGAKFGKLSNMPGNNCFKKCRPNFCLNTSRTDVSSVTKATLFSINEVNHDSNSCKKNDKLAYLNHNAAVMKLKNSGYELAAVHFDEDIR